MCKQNIGWLFFSLLSLFPCHMQAADLYAVQGDIVNIKLQQTAKSVHAFGKSWPVKTDAGTQALQSWIGIDLDTAVGTHSIQITHHNGKTEQFQLGVDAGDFPQSYITVPKKMSSFDPETLQRIRNDQSNLKTSYVAIVDANPDIRMHFMPALGEISTTFGARRHVNGVPRSAHSGLDIAALQGSDVLLPLAGKVLHTSHMYLNGNTITIGHGNGLVSVFCHLQDILVQEDDWLETGALIAHVGNTGRSTGPHLHWSIRYQNARVHPNALLQP